MKNNNETKPPLETGAATARHGVVVCDKVMTTARRTCSASRAPNLGGPRPSGGYCCYYYILCARVINNRCTADDDALAPCITLSLCLSVARTTKIVHDDRPAARTRVIYFAFDRVEVIYSPFTCVRRHRRRERPSWVVKKKTVFFLFFSLFFPLPETPRYYCAYVTRGVRYVLAGI